MMQYIGAPAPPGKLVGRKEEVEYIMSRMASTRVNYNIAVLGHRRIGKTSILNKVENELSKKDTVVAYFDVKRNMSVPGMFLKRLQKCIFDAHTRNLSKRSRIQAGPDRLMAMCVDIMKSLASKKIKSIGVEIAEGSIIPKIEIGEKTPEYGNLFYSVLGTATALSEKSGRKFVIILDEFQDIGKLENYTGLKNIFDLFRSAMQERGKKVSYIVSGSRVHMLKEMFGGGESALFTHFDPLNVGELDEKSSVQLFKATLMTGKKSTWRSASKEAYELVGGQPLYLTVLAGSWDGRQKMSELLTDQLSKAAGTLGAYCEHLLDGEPEVIGKGPVPRAIMRALSCDVEGLSYSEIAKKISYPMTRLPRYTKMLTNADLIVRNGTKFKIRDPVLFRYLEIESEGLF